VLEWIQLDSRNYKLLPDAAETLAKYGFYFSLSVCLYVVLFPFRFDFSWQFLSTAWSKAILTPYCFPNRGFRITADDLANILMTVPLGFMGFLYFGDRSESRALLKWSAMGLAFGLASECIQLAIPTRASVITDALNNGLGALLGAAAASSRGWRTLEYFTGIAKERRNIYLWLLIWALVAMMGPYSLDTDSLSGIGAHLGMISNTAAESEISMGEQWLRMAGFALIGALAIRLAVPGRRRSTWRQPLSTLALIFLFPVILHIARLLIGSPHLALDDLALDVFSAIAGGLVSLFVSPGRRPWSGFLLCHVALIAAGLSPYDFSGWQRGSSFQWIPFYELCIHRTPAALYQATLYFVGFAVLGGFMRLSFPRRSGWCIAAYALVLSGAIEFAQTFLPARIACTSDVILCSLGAWTGAYICNAVESARLNEQAVEIL
jgi:glycopeptide antibiotics resistance protein